MEQTNKRKSKWTALLVREKKDGTIRQHHLNAVFLEVTAFLLFILVLAGACQLIYKSIQVENMRKEVANNRVAIDSLTATGDTLQKENEELSEKVTVLSETVAKKAAMEEVKEEEVMEISLPKGFPLSGSASMEESAADGRILIFRAAAGNTVVTVGSGIVEAIEADETYGTKITVDHQNGYKSVYGNQGDPLVKVEEELGKGYILFLVGEENQELYYQVMKDGAFINPMDIIEISG